MRKSWTTGHVRLTELDQRVSPEFNRLFVDDLSILKQGGKYVCFLFFLAIDTDGDILPRREYQARPKEERIRRGDRLSPFPSGPLSVILSPLDSTKSPHSTGQKDTRTASFPPILSHPPGEH